MSLMQDITRISVTGSRENVTRMLNAAIRNVGTGNVINSDDDIERVNHKIKEEDGRYGLRVALIDFFDEVCLQDAKLQEKIKILEGKQADESECEDEEDCFYEEEVSFARMFDLLKVCEAEDVYTVDIEIYEWEGGCYGGWNHFEDIARLYQCRIIADDELFRNGCSLGLNQTTIWEPEGDDVKETIIRPEDINNCSDIEKAFLVLMKMDSQRYSKYKIRAYEILISNLEYEVKKSKASLEWYKTMEEEGVELPTVYRDFIYSEQDGLESVKMEHKSSLSYSMYSEEELATIFKLRAKRLHDKDKELADLYEQLLANLHTDIEEEKEHQRKIDEEKKKLRIDLIVKRFANTEVEGIERVEQLYQKELNNAYDPDFLREVLSEALRQLAEKSKNENTAFAPVYQRLYTQFSSDVEQKRKEMEEMKAAQGDEEDCSVEEDENGNLNFCVCGVDFKMIKVEAGTFMMGAAENQVEEAYKDRELPVHQVTISNDYYIAEIPVTWKLWGEVMNEGYDEDDEPIMAYDWYDTYKFINRLNEITGKQFRLPTEAEWEFAARGGKKSKGYKYSGSDNVDEVAWHDGNSHDNRHSNPEANCHPVKLKIPNELGLYDMSGNMWEQCHDGYAEYTEEAQTDPIGDLGSELKVLRGGCHENLAKSCRTSHRFFIEAKADDDNIDIYDNTTYRLVLSPFMPEDIPTDFDEEDEEEDCRETISSREEIVGMPIHLINEFIYIMDITDEESEKLKDGDSVKIYVGGPYFADKKAIVEAEALPGFKNNELLLNSTLYQLQSALKDKWEKNDCGHNFEDFVIEVFDMKITKGKVAIHIELGS